ncbi:glutamate receptor ionotropic, delta-2 isoform X2 [Polistes fuscatus]|uniref:glutamate receptor ionotropic, delta-2 isoform X2 n=1 Tax=Polistes fuscatus TaxID=30207 RepID=UPI001CAA27C3|nr:glutamate receptor ionotropic, delta-2 isoform X2 [Polistes fuscatus]
MNNNYYFLFAIIIHISFHIGKSSETTEQDMLDFENQKKAAIPPVLKVSSWNDMPFSGIIQKNGKWIGTGYAFYILDLLSDKLNFTYTVIPPTGQIFGNKNRGIISMLYKKEVDMIAAFVPVLEDLRKYCLFSTTLDVFELTAMMKRPEESATGSGLLAPFDNTVWFCVLTAVLVVGPTIYLFSLIRLKLWKGTEGENYNLPSCMWFVYSALLKQGSTIIAQTDSTRMLFATWWIFILILTSFYTANLTAFLTKPQFTLPINNIKDIVNKGYKWVTFKGRVIDYLLSQPYVNELTLLNQTTFQGEYITMYNEPASYIFDTVENKKLYLGERHYFRKLLFEDYINKTREGLEHNKRCTYVIMPGSILSRNRAFAFPLNSTIVDDINMVLSSLIESGLIKHKKRSDLPLANVCPVDLQSTERQLRNTDLSLTYEVIAAGYIIAMIVFIIELIIKYINYCKNKKDARQSSKIQKQTIKYQENSEQSLWASRLPLYDTTNNNYWRDNNFSLVKRSPPLLYHYNEGNTSFLGKRHNINGRNYYVVVDRSGSQRLIPIRTPSAFLFQYTA